MIICILGSENGFYYNWVFDSMKYIKKLQNHELNS